MKTAEAALVAAPASTVGPMCAAASLARASRVVAADSA